MRIGNVCCFLALLGAGWGLAGAATPVQVYDVELATGFESVTGKLVLIGDQVVFVDDAAPEASFAVSRSELGSSQLDGRSLTFETREPVMHRTSPRTSLAFRIRGSADVSGLERWAANTRPATATTPVAVAVAVAPAAASETIGTYKVKHLHGFMGGSCIGQLIIGQDKLSYDSVDHLDHSRQWAMGDIREIQHDNPYRLELDVFVGKDYAFEFAGQGMDSQAHQRLVELVTQARVQN